MISAGEESGKLGEVLDEISVFYAKQLKDHIKAVTGMIEPIMILLWAQSSASSPWRSSCRSSR
jgi:type II secretory pathway component PulF